MGGAGVQNNTWPQMRRMYTCWLPFSTPQPLGVITYNLRFHDSGVLKVPYMKHVKKHTRPHFHGEMAGLRSFQLGHAKGRPDQIPKAPPSLLHSWMQIPGENRL